MTWIISLWSSTSFWEGVEYIAEAVVIIGATFELLADFEHILKGDENKELRKRVEKYAAIALIIGLAVGLGALVRTNQLFSDIISDADDRAKTAFDKAASAIERNTELEARLADRHLTVDQRQQMLAILKGSPGTKVMVTYLLNGDGDSQEYAIEIGSVVRDAPGWTVVPPPPGVSSEQPVYGFAIQAQNNSTISKLPLIESVLAVTRYKVIRWPLKPGPDEIDIYVGRKAL